MKALTSDQKEALKTAKANLIWMHYFNRYLFDNEIISEADRNYMERKIEAKFGTFQKLPVIPNL